MYQVKTHCRVCNGDLKDILSLGPIHISTFVEDNTNPPPKIPIDLMQCKDCGLMQLRHTVDSDVMYSDYWYQSGLNQSMRDALKDIVDNITRRIALNESDTVVDIGANDGTLLENYPLNVWTVGYEPNKLAEIGKNRCDYMCNDYFSAKVYPYNDRAKVITAIAMFYDLDNPHTFVEDVKSVLAPDGIFVVQMMDLISMIKYTDFTNQCHEHLIYYSLKAFDDLMRQHDLQIFDVEYNKVNGGSLRAYVQHKDTGAQEVSDNVFSALLDEEEYFKSIGDVAEYFSNNIAKVKDKIVSFIKRCNGNNLDVGIIGASTKGNTLLQYFELSNNNIIHAAEVNKDKYGLKTVGTNIPIVSEEESLKQRLPYYLILPWGFLDSFIKKYDSYLKMGGTFIVPLPTPRLVYYDIVLDKVVEWNL